MTRSNAAIFDEMLASQKSRDELMKWKLIVISAVGSVGLGLSVKISFDNLRLVLAVIPIACVYVDMLCRYLSLRTKRINRFISTLPDSGDLDVMYAKFYLDVRNKAGKTLESYALIWSTIFISLSLCILGLFTKDNNIVRYTFIIVGLLCVLVSIVVQMRYSHEKRVLESLSPT